MMAPCAAAATSKTLVLERLNAEFPSYAVRGEAARAVAREIFHSEKLLKPYEDTVEIRLSVANVFAAAENALGRGEAVEVRAAGEVCCRCTPGDASALGDEFRRAGRGGAAEAWAAGQGDRTLCAVFVEGPGDAPRVGVASCSGVARAVTLFAFVDDASYFKTESCLSQVACDEVLVAGASGGDAAIVEAARRCGAAASTAGAAAFGRGGAKGLAEVGRALRAKCGGGSGSDDDGDDAARVVDEAAQLCGGAALRAASALLERLASTAAFEDDYAVSVGDLSGVVALDGATLRALDLVGDRGCRAPQVCGLVTPHAATPGGKRLLEDWIRLPLSDARAIAARHAAVRAGKG